MANPHHMDNVAPASCRLSCGGVSPSAKSRSARAGRSRDSPITSYCDGGATKKLQKSDQSFVPYLVGIYFMNKHIFGITIFIAIVSLSVFTHEYFSYSGEPDCGRVMSARCVSAISRTEPLTLKEDDFGNYTPEDMQVRIQYIEANMWSRTVKTRIKLEWLSDKEPPKAIWLQLRFNKWDKSDPGLTSDPVRIVSPFLRKDPSIVIENSFDCGACTNQQRNLYASASVWTRANTGTNLAYKIGDMIPVVVRENR